MNTTKEWRMVCDLMAVKEKITVSQQLAFIQSLYEHASEFTPLSDELSEDQIEYLYSLYKKYCPED